MRILSLNCWGGMLHDALCRYLADVDADILCLQEVSRAPRGTPDWLTYRDGETVLQQRANLYDALRAVLPDHDGFFCPTARGLLSDGDREHWQSFGNATFVRSSLPIIGQTLDFVHGSYSADDFGPHPRPRNAHGIRVFDHARNRSLSIFHLHGLREESGKADTPARTVQSQRLRAMITAFHHADEPLVVCGDLNLLPDSATFTELAELGLIDLVKTGGFADTRTSHYRKPGRYADYMLVNSAVPYAAFDVVSEPEVSDHRALLLTLR